MDWTSSFKIFSFKIWWYTNLKLGEILKREKNFIWKHVYIFSNYWFLSIIQNTGVRTGGWGSNPPHLKIDKCLYFGPSSDKLVCVKIGYLWHLEQIDRSKLDLHGIRRKISEPWQRLQKYFEDACDAMQRNFRFLHAAIARLEIFGAFLSHLAHCDLPLAFKQNGSTVKEPRLHLGGEVELQRMNIQRMITWTSGLWHHFSLMRVIHGHQTCTIIALQNVGGMVCWRLKIEWNFNDYPISLKKRKQEKL